MSWLAPTPEGVLSGLTPAEATKFQQVLGGTTTTQKIVPILDNVVSNIRGCIIAGRYEVDSDSSLIPEGLIKDAIAMARWDVITAMPDLAAVQSDARKEANDRALDKLDKIAAGDWPIESPTTASDISGGNWNSENRILMRTHPVPPPGAQDTEASGSYANS